MEQIPSFLKDIKCCNCGKPVFNTFFSPVGLLQKQDRSVWFWCSKECGEKYLKNNSLVTDLNKLYIDAENKSSTDPRRMLFEILSTSKNQEE